MKNLKGNSILFSLLAMIAFAVFLTSCEQGYILDNEPLNEQSQMTLESFQTTDINQLIEDLNLSNVSLEDASIEVEETLHNSDEVMERMCCNVGSIYNLRGGTNRFRVPLTYGANSSFIITVWKGGSFWSSGNISIPFSSCTTSYHLTDLDNYAPIQQGESYILRVFLYSGSGAFCDMGSKNFVGE